MKEDIPQDNPNFEDRKAFFEKANGGPVEINGRTLWNIRADNPYFPYYLIGEDRDAFELLTIKLDNNHLPKIVQKRQEREVDDSQHLRDLVEETGDEFLGILVKLSTKSGMSSQLIKRYGEKKRGEISCLLDGEKAYEEIRHTTNVFYQTKNFTDIPSSDRDTALGKMKMLQLITDDTERQRKALEDPIIGFEKK